ncbi:hypothetical protein GQ55_2G480600 [Panicum hallii var. hallii]|uniref:Uncharacterized protein n=1 Tax=Panicum hallii var. hallii TaxID=1504633 RepID=A0A2T7F0B9_9POAL|nr:hypothetical protein GQ55_2G480600 [Panicum hallii var. hallii]
MCSFDCYGIITDSSLMLVKMEVHRERERDRDNGADGEQVSVGGLSDSRALDAASTVTISHKATHWAGTRCPLVRRSSSSNPLHQPALPQCPSSPPQFVSAGAALQALSSRRARVRLSFHRSTTPPSNSSPVPRARSPPAPLLDWYRKRRSIRASIASLSLGGDPMIAMKPEQLLSWKQISTLINHVKH